MDALHLVNQIYQYIQEYKLILPEDKVVLGVSGGGDSIALLHILYEIRARLKMQLIVAHLDHQLRAGESEEDLTFVRSQAQALGLPFVEGKEDVKMFSESEGLSLEDAARRVRYDFLRSVAVSHQAQKIAVGHTKEDQAETLLLRLMRGTGMQGLGGMRPSRPLEPVTLIRPLLETSKEMLRSYLNERNLTWREDSSNQEIFPTRNKVRKLLIPFLEKEFNPKILDELFHLSQILGVDHEYLQRETLKVFRELVRPAGKTLSFSIDSFKDLDLAIQRRLIREIFCALVPDGNLSYQHVENVLSFLKSSQSGRGIILPKGVEGWREFDQFFAGKRELKNVLNSELIQVPGEKVMEGKRVQFKIGICRRSVKDIPPLAQSESSLVQTWGLLSEGRAVEYCEYFSADKIEDSVVIRSRQAGDLYDPIGLGSFKAVKEIFIDEKVPLSFRKQIPIFVSGKKIFWIGGYRISESFKVQADSPEVLEVRLSMIPQLS